MTEYKNPLITIHADLESTDEAAVATANDPSTTNPIKGNRQLPTQQLVSPKAATKPKKKKKVSQKNADINA